MDKDKCGKFSSVSLVISLPRSIFDNTEFGPGHRGVNFSFGGGSCDGFLVVEIILTTYSHSICSSSGENK